MEAHRAGLEPIAQAGGKPVSWVQLICELQRDWVCLETAKPFTEILFGQPHPVERSPGTIAETYIATHRGDGS